MWWQILEGVDSPHVVVFLEKRIVLHSSLLQLHIDAAAIYRNHLLDSAKTKGKEEFMFNDHHLGMHMFAKLKRKFKILGVKGHYSLNAAEASRQLHDGSQRVTPSNRGGQIGHQKAFQHIQNFIFSHLNSKRMNEKHINLWWPGISFKFEICTLFFCAQIWLSLLCVLGFLPGVPGWVPPPHTVQIQAGLHTLLCTRTPPGPKVAMEHRETQIIQYKYIQ